MNKSFTKEDEPEEDSEPLEMLPEGVKNLMTPLGLKTLQDELYHLLHRERPKIVEIVSWAAGNGDRSENGDYLYNKKRLREIDRRVRYLMKKTETAEVVDPRHQQSVEQVFFGATVTYVHEDETELTVKLVGVDEADMDQGKINWLSPVARSLMKSRIGDSVNIRLEGRIELVEILDIRYEIE